MTTLQQ